MQFRLRRPLILLAVVAYLATAGVFAMYSPTMAEAVSDYVMELSARAVFRGVCSATFE
jgi:hypothetical protein